MQVISVTPTDAQALAKLGELHDGEGDKSQAFQYYYEVPEAFMAGGFLSKLHCTEVNSTFFVCGPIVKNSNLYNEKIVCFFCHFFAHLLVNYVRVV